MGSDCRLTVSVCVSDPKALWTKARFRLASFAMDEETIVETLGPGEDPLIEECLLTLLDPASWDDCGIESIDCVAAAPEPVPSQVVDLPPAAPARSTRSLSLWRGHSPLPMLKGALG